MKIATVVNKKGIKELEFSSLLVYVLGLDITFHL